jgi:branched-chain amino acid transport system ATP-binding protein
MARPKLLLLDEPCRGLTPETAREIYRVIYLVNEQGTAILSAEEEFREDRPAAAKGYVLEGGRLVEGREPF